MFGYQMIPEVLQRKMGAALEDDGGGVGSGSGSGVGSGSGALPPFGGIT